MRVVSVTVLMRDVSALHAALAVLRGSALNFDSAWDPIAVTGGGLSAGVWAGNSAGPVVELLASPSLPVRWDDRKGRAPVRALLASVNLESLNNAAAVPGLSIAALSARVAGDGARGRVLSVLAGLGLDARAGAQVGGPAMVVNGSVHVLSCPLPRPLLRPRPRPRPSEGGTGSGGAAETSKLDVEMGVLKEVVIGAQGRFLTTALGLAGSMEADRFAARDALATCAWRLAACGTTLRLLPSRYSALVLNAPRGQLRAIKARLDAAGADGLSGEFYGDRHGTAESGQVVVICDALAGLDMRICVAAGVRPFFNEAREELTDYLDPNLNPEPGSAAQQNNLACSSISSLDLVSTLKLRLLGRVGN